MLKAGFIHAQNSGVGYYRFWLPARWLSEQKLAEVRRLSDQPPALRIQGPEPSVQALAEWADVICLDALLPNRQVFAAYRASCSLAGTPLVVVADDLYTNVAPWNCSADCYGEMALEERYEISAAPDGIENDQLPTGLYIAEYRGKRSLFRERAVNSRYICLEALRAADAVITTTQMLHEAYAGENPQRHVCPNCLDWDAWDDEFPAPRRPHDRVRIMYAGSAHHKDDLVLIVPALAKVLADRPETEFLLVFPGPLPPRLEKLRAFGERFRHIFAPIAPRSYPGALVAYAPDISLGPLWPHPFNECRSPLKWLEATGARAAFVGSRIRPFEEAVEDGKTGYLARTTGDWTAAMLNLVDRPDERAQMVRAARGVGEERYGARSCGSYWQRALVETVARHRALRQAQDLEGKPSVAATPRRREAAGQ